MTATASRDFAWKVHDSISDWTGKVDAKASIILALETALIGFVVILSAGSGPLTKLDHSALVLYRIGLAALILSAIFAAAAVFPQLRRRHSRKGSNEGKEGLIYFGDLQHQDATSLASNLEKLTDAEILAALSRQLIVTSRIAWIKHSFLQYSMSLAVLSGLLLFFAHSST